MDYAHGDESGKTRDKARQARWALSAVPAHLIFLIPPLNTKITANAIAPARTFLVYFFIPNSNIKKKFFPKFKH